MSNTCSCGGCGCSVCQPANIIFNRVCTDPGVINAGANLIVGDSNFCQRRLAPSPGFVVTNSTPNGYEVTSTTEPNVDLSTFGVVNGGVIGNILVRNSDGIIRTLLPAAVANLILMTNALGQFVLQPPPAPVIPDPLSVTTANITTLTVANETITVGLKFTGLSIGTIASTIGLDAGGNVVIGSPSATGVQAAMFFESATSPGAGSPNSGATAGTFLIIGNQLYDSGGSLIGITNSTTLKVLVAGKYILQFGAEVSYGGGNHGNPTINLVINGVNVNPGFANPNFGGLAVNTALSISGVNAMDLAVNDTIQLQLGAGSGSGTHVYEARVVAQKFQ